MMFNIGDQQFTSRDCWNHLRDINVVLNYCKKQQAKNPNFFHAIQCDDVGYMVNFFWVDVQSRIAYHYYGDVVTFDAAYNSNKYDMDTCFPLGKLCSKLLDIKCINLNSPMSRNSSDQQMDTY